VSSLAFFVGKGGVGKTTVSAAYALHVAARSPRKKVLLLSSDPAHSLADVFEQTVSGKSAKRVRLPFHGRLFVWQVDAERQFGDFLKEHKERLLRVLEAGSIFSREDIEALLNTTLPGMAEMATLLSVSDALRSGEFDHVVVDTAPFGHTLRLFELPTYLSRFVDFLELAARRDQVLAAHFGGRARSQNSGFLADWRERVATIRRALSEDAQLCVVSTPEKFSLNESKRSVAELRVHLPRVTIHAVILNRAVLSKTNCRICRSKFHATRAAQVFLKRHFPRATLLVARDAGAPVTGAAGLKAFGRHVFLEQPLRWLPKAPRSREVTLNPAAWPVLATPLSLVVGKGGVGKTTVSAGLGFHTRSKVRVPVDLCSVDPAPSLDDIFRTAIGDRPRAVLGDSAFRASELDAPQLFRGWADRMKDMVNENLTPETSGVHVDFGFERQLFFQLLDSVPPGLDEIFAVLRLIEVLGSKSSRIIIDMAPTGHALELLRTPERILAWTRLLLKSLAAHRTLSVVKELGVKVAELGKEVRELAGSLTNARHTQIFTVMLPEALPDLETERLMRELRTLELASRSIFVNRVLFREDIGRCASCQLVRKWQLKTMAKLKIRYPDAMIYVVRHFPAEIAGKKALRAFTNELWNLA